MRVLFVTNERGLRGGERQLLLLARELAHLGVDVGLCAREGAQVLGRFKPAWSCAMANELDPRGMIGVMRAAEEFRADLVHAFTARAHALSLLAKRPLVVTRSVAFRAAKGLWGGIKYEKAARFIAVSGAARAQLLLAGVRPEKIETIFPALDPQAISTDREAIRDRLCLRPEDTVIGFLGALEREKGVADLIDALARIRQACIGLFVGDGSLRAALEERARRLLGARARFLGAIEDGSSVLAAMDVYVQPSHDEGFGLAAAEAMAAGVPVVMTATGGLLELAADGRNGLLVKAKSPDDLAARLEECLADPLAAASRARAASRWVHENLRPARIAEATLDAYRKALG